MIVRRYFGGYDKRAPSEAVFVTLDRNCLVPGLFVTKPKPKPEPEPKPKPAATDATETKHTEDPFAFVDDEDGNESDDESTDKSDAEHDEDEDVEKVVLRKLALILSRNTRRGRFLSDAGVPGLITLTSCDHGEHGAIEIAHGPAKLVSKVEQLAKEYDHVDICNAVARLGRFLDKNWSRLKAPSSGEPGAVVGTIIVCREFE
jgi:hypothetical protein